MKRDVKIERIYPHPAAVVWRALTEPKALGEWLMANDFAPRVGHEFRFRTKPAPGFDGIVQCKVLEVDEPRRLSYSWAGGPLDTVVSFTLEPVATGTRLRIEHRGFDGVQGFILRMMLGAGWKKMARKKLPIVLDRIASGDAAFSPSEECSGIGTQIVGHVVKRLGR
ncbi:MAG: SRPBCC domain-containing protein [Planctomycetes bacterium]|nr:SRPBCC domain-containing protein [Planctomycetota bacterium]MBI3848419.1 SRPBCC domain-containing protein [Planctomycetota bacterium]